MKAPVPPSDYTTVSNCSQCEQPLAYGALVCDKCRTLVHARELENLSASAKELETLGKLHEAHEKWVEAMLLLPSHSKQTEWIKTHLRDLEEKIEARQIPQPEAQPKSWARKLGPLAPIAVVLAKSKMLFTTVFKMKFLLSFFAFLGVYWSLYGFRFGIGFAVLILVHEMGHFIDIKRRGLPADMPVFMPGLGAYVRWEALGVSLETRAAVSLAGPLAGVIACAACLAIWSGTGDPLWAALARASAWLNILNLIPVWVLDGGQAAAAMDKADRIILLTAGLALWAIFGEAVFFLVAAGATYRLFTRDFPSRPSRMTTAYFVLLLVALGLVMRAAPGTPGGLP